MSSDRNWSGVIKQRQIGKQASAFRLYVNSILPNEKARHLLSDISLQCDVFVFGGVIRNFLLGYPFHRDLDIVVCTDKPLTIPISLIKGFGITKNKFGGVKLSYEDFSVDVWNINNSWGILNKGGKNTPYNLIRTVFFNFSAIIYDYNNSRFIKSELFDNFYKSRTMEVVYSSNPFPASCVVNTFHYTQIYNFAIGKSLRKWICKYGDADDYERQQIKRYGKVMYSNEVVNSFVELCRKIKEPRTVVSMCDSYARQYILKFE